MSMVFELFLSMSISGTLLIFAFLAGKRLWKRVFSRQWQYYIWLIVILRLLIPFGPEENLMRTVYRSAGQTAAQKVSMLLQKEPDESGRDFFADFVRNCAKAASNYFLKSRKMQSTGLEMEPAEKIRPNENHYPNPGSNQGSNEQTPWNLLAVSDGTLWMIWLVIAAGMLIRKITIYQSFTRYIRAGQTPVSRIVLLEQLSAAAEQMGVKRPVELCANPLISSPLLIGFFHPCIVLPSEEVCERDFHYTALHELAHCKRRDMIYKWLVQITVCLHWFNPMVHVMGREINKACEFSCDEAVLMKLKGENAREYGEMLLEAMAAVGKRRKPLGAVMLSENKRLLKERLHAIMNYQKKSKGIIALTAVLTAGIAVGMFFVGICPTAAAEKTPPEETEQDPDKDTEQIPAEEAVNSSSWAEHCYETGNLPLFQLEFSHLKLAEQKAWLEKIYTEDEAAFFSVSLDVLEDGALIRELAEKAYGDDNISFFSILTQHMEEATLEKWLDRAEEDERISFQSVLYGALDKEEEWDAKLDILNAEQEAELLKEYSRYDIEIDGKKYYYKEQLVHIFLDIRQDSSFYTFNLNPRGEVDIIVNRNQAGQIKSVDYLSEEEARKLLGDMRDEETIPVDLETLEGGDRIFLGEYTLSDGDEIRYDVCAEKGSALLIGFVKAEDTHSGSGRSFCYAYAMQNRRVEGVELACRQDVIFGPPVDPGTYKLFIEAPESRLEHVEGSISITYAASAP